MRVVVVGAGLAGCVVASRLSDDFEVTLIHSPTVPQVTGYGYDHTLNPCIASGLGGTTRYWHNVLIQIDQRCLRNSSNWLKNLKRFIAPASKIFGLDFVESRRRVDESLLDLVRDNDLPQGLSFGEPQFVPRRRMCTKDLLDGSIRLMETHIQSYQFSDSGVTAALPSSGPPIVGDIFIDATGGLGVLQTLGRRDEEKKKGMDGNICASYEDHLCGFLGAIEFTDTYRVSQLHGTAEGEGGWRWRVPLVYETRAGYRIALYFFPRLRLKNESIKSSRHLLSDLRNGINVFSGIKDLLFSPSNIYNLISFYSGDSKHCKTYEVFAVLEHPQGCGRVHFDLSAKSIELHANLPACLQSDLQKSFKEILSWLGASVKSSTFYEKISLDTGAHFSGTFPVNRSVDEHYRVHGVDNLFVAGGAVLPETGYSNTGLTITAQALALSELLRSNYL